MQLFILLTQNFLFFPNLVNKSLKKYLTFGEKLFQKRVGGDYFSTKYTLYSAANGLSYRLSPTCSVLNVNSFLLLGLFLSNICFCSKKFIWTLLFGMQTKIWRKTVVLFYDIPIFSVFKFYFLNSTLTVWKKRYLPYFAQAFKSEKNVLNLYLDSVKDGCWNV